MKINKSRIIILLIGCAVLFLLVWAYLFTPLPLPFIRNLWEEGVLRNNMAGSASRRVNGLHQEDIVLMLGEPDRDSPRWLSSIRPMSPWLYCVNQNNEIGRYFVIFFDEDGFARHIEIGSLESSRFRLNIIDIEV